MLEWLAGAVGAFVVAGLVGTIGYQALIGSSGSPPEIAVKVSSIERSGDYFVVEVAATNRSDATAQQVQIEATLTRQGRKVETGNLTFSYLPGGSKVEGGIYLTEDPRIGRLEIRPLGYSVP